MKNEENNYTCTLKSRCKYEPFFHIIKVVTLLNGETTDCRVKTASFPLTQFIAVKNYQNKDLSQLRNRVRHHEPKSALPQGVPAPGVPVPGVPPPGVPAPGVSAPGVPAPGVPPLLRPQRPCPILMCDRMFDSNIAFDNHMEIQHNIFTS